jgi:hypothetical protein
MSPSPHLKTKRLRLILSKGPNRVNVSLPSSEGEVAEVNYF